MSRYKPTIGSVLVIVMLLPLCFGAFASTAEAGPAAAAASVLTVPTTDVPQMIKENVEDTLVNLAVNAALAGLMTAITNWAKNGFEGHPVFVQNLQKAFKNIEGEATKDVLNEIKFAGFNAGYFCGPFDQELRNAFRLQLAIKTSNSTFTQRSQCTIESILEKGGQTLKGFESDFSQGGWPAWLELTSPNNNRYGAYFNVYLEQLGRETQQQEDKSNELNYGKGFLSQKHKGECTFVGPMPPSDPNNGPPLPPDYCPPEYKQPDYWVTPGSVVEDQLNKHLSLGIGRLTVADEFDEMIGAIMIAFVKKALSSVGGLIGANGNEDKDPNGSLVDQLKGWGDEQTSKQDGVRQSAQGLIDKYGAPSSTPCPSAPVAKTDGTLNGKVGGDDFSASFKSTTDPGQVPCPAPVTTSGSGDINLDINNLSDSGATSGDVNMCFYQLSGQPASKGLTWTHGKVNGPSDGRSIAMAIDGMEVDHYYGTLTANFDMHTGANPSKHTFGIDRTNIRNYYGYTDIGITEGWGSKTRFDDWPTYKTSGGINWQPNRDYHVTLTLDAKANTIKLVATDSSGTGQMTISDAMPGPDLVNAGGTTLTFNAGGASDWVFNNIRVDLTPGGPYAGGARGACGL